MNWPTELEGFFSAVSVIGEASNSILSFDCFINANISSSERMNPFFMKILISAMLPLMLIIFYALFWAPISYKFNSMYFYKRAVIVSVIVCIFLIHPTLMELAFSMYNCYSLEGESYMMKDMRIICWESEHASYAFGLGLPMIFIWIIGFPLLGFLILYKNK